MKTTTEQALAEVQRAYGFVPNMLKALSAESPAVATAYIAASQALGAGELSPQERQVVMLAASAFNACSYCQAAHRTAAKAMGVSQSELDAISRLQLPRAPRLAALCATTWSIQRTPGALHGNHFPVSQPELLEVIAIIGLKTITNYVNRVLETELDPHHAAQTPPRNQQAA